MIWIGAIKQVGNWTEVPDVSSARLMLLWEKSLATAPAETGSDHSSLLWPRSGFTASGARLDPPGLLLMLCSDVSGLHPSVEAATCTQPYDEFRDPPRSSALRVSVFQSAFIAWRERMHMIAAHTNVRDIAKK